MLFASRGLASQIEWAECSLLRESVLSVAETRPDRGATVIPLSGGVATYSGKGSPLNKVAGLGFAGPPALDELGQVEHLYLRRSCPVQIELSSLADPEVAPLLTSRGYQLVGFENVLGRDLGSDSNPSSSTAGLGIEIKQTREQDFRAWLDTVVTGFMSPDADGIPAHESFARETLEEVIGDMAGASGLIRYLAFRGAEPAGAASMRLHDKIAQLSGASTLPSHRRHGVQTALLARRLADAARAGCEVAVVTTQPGSVSQKNAQRNGFELLYARAVLVLPPPE